MRASDSDFSKGRLCDSAVGHGLQRGGQLLLAFANRLARRASRRQPPRMAATAYRYLVNLPGVCQGRTIVEGTRIGVHDVVGLIVNGAAVDDVLRSFPDLTRAQVYECLAFYEDHRTVIDALVAEQMAERGA